MVRGANQRGALYLLESLGQRPLLVFSKMLGSDVGFNRDVFARRLQVLANGQHTNTNRQHLDETVEAVGSDYRIFTVDNGVCRQEGGMQ